MGIGGDVITGGCFTGPAGGTIYPMRFTFTLPATESENLVTGTAHGNVGNCHAYAVTMSVALCPGGFYVYKPSSHPHGSMAYITRKK